MNINALRGRLAGAAVTGLSLVAIGASAAQAAPIAGTPVADRPAAVGSAALAPGPYTVSAWTPAPVFRSATTNSPQASRVAAGGSYGANCWQTGQPVVDKGYVSVVWVQLPLNAGGVGYVSAIYLRGDGRGNLPLSAVC